MTDRRWQFVADKIGALDPALSVSDRICAVALELLGARSVSLALVIDHAYSSIADSDALGTLLDEEQFALGDGPTFEAQTSSAAIVLDDVAAHRASARWPIFAKLAQEHEIRGVFAFPLRIGDAYLGVLSVYRGRPGEPTAVEYTDGLILSSLATAELVRRQAGGGGKPDTDIFKPGFYDQSALQIAAGMVAESLNVSLVAALVRIRARAFADELPVNRIAQQIVARTLILDH